MILTGTKAFQELETDFILRIRKKILLNHKEISDELS